MPPPAEVGIQMTTNDLHILQVKSYVAVQHTLIWQYNTYSAIIHWHSNLGSLELCTLGQLILFTTLTLHFGTIMVSPPPLYKLFGVF